MLGIARTLRVATLAVAAATLGCTTLGGPLGDPIDLAPTWPPGTTAPRAADLAVHHVTAPVDTPATLLHVEWTTFRQGGKELIATVAARLEGPSLGLTVGKPSLLWSSFPTAPDGPPGVVQEAQISVDWDRRRLTTGSASSVLVEVRGDGTHRP